MMYINRSPIRSSWNSDRVAACHICRQDAVRAARKSYLYAQYRNNEVSVCGTRGKVRFTVKFDRKVISAVVRDDRLIVMTEDACVRHYDVMTRKLLFKQWPTPPEGGSFDAAYSFAA